MRDLGVRGRAAGSLAIALLFAPPGIRAQEAAPSGAAISAQMAALHVGDAVRVFAPPRPRVEGRVASPWPAGRLRVELDDPTGEVVELPLALVDSLSMAVGRGEGGAFLGGAIGAGLGLLALHGLANLFCEAVDNDCDSGPDTVAWIGFAAGGAALGAGIGWIVGRDTPRWETVYP